MDTIWPDNSRDRKQIAPDVRAATRSCFERKSPWPLFLYGGCGSGKTCAALCVLDYVGSGLYYTAEEWAEICEEARKGRLQYSSGHKRTLLELRRDFKAAGMVVIDELGNRKMSDRDYTNLLWAIDVRQNKPLICCSNENLAMILSVYDNRIASRLRGGTRVLLEGDRRKDKGVKWQNVKS